MEQKTNKLAIISLVIMIVNIAFLFFPETEKVPTNYIIVGMLVLAIIQIVVSSMAKKEISKDETQKGMGMAKTAFVFGLFAAVFLSVSLLGLYMLNNDEMRNTYICPQATDCVDNEDGTSTCKFSNEEIICNNKTEESTDQETQSDETPYENEVQE